MEEAVWRHILSFLITLTLFIIFVGAYHAGRRGWWWMGIIFVIFVYVLMYHHLEPD